MTRLKLGAITLHWGSKDGGPESRVYMYGIEAKKLASCLVLRFEDGSREAYHSHAFNALSILLQGELEEYLFARDIPSKFSPDSGWIWTGRHVHHKVVSIGRTWVLSFRGPWARTWQDHDERTGTTTTLTNGRIPTAGRS